MCMCMHACMHTGMHVCVCAIQVCRHARTAVNFEVLNADVIFV